jgi:CheY-like chemotaxis protein
MFAIGLMGAHVFLVDDDEDALDVFGSYLQHLGAVVTAAREVPAVFESFRWRRDGHSSHRD